MRFQLFEHSIRRISGEKVVKSVLCFAALVDINATRSDAGAVGQAQTQDKKGLNGTG